MALHRRLFFLLLVFLPTQLGIHFWPHWSTVMGRRVDYLSPTIHLTDIIIGLVLIFWFIDRVRKNTRRALKQKNIIFDFSFFILIFIFVIVNCWFAASPWVSVYKWIKIIEYIGLAWYVSASAYRLSDIGTPLAIGVIYSSVLAIMQFIFQHSVGLWILGERTFDSSTPGIALWDGFGKLLLRAYATFPHPNVLGGYLVIVLLLIVQKVWSEVRFMSFLSKFFFGITFFLGSITLYLTFSRSAWLAAGLGALYYIFRGVKKHRVVWIALYISMLVGSCYILAPKISDTSVTHRAELNRMAIDLWKQSPYIGVGLGNFIVRLPETKVTRHGNYLQPVHNIYLLLLSEIGIVGVCFIVFVWLRCYKHLSKPRPPASFSILHFTLLIILILGFVDHYLLTLQQGQVLFTLVLGMSIVRNS